MEGDNGNGLLSKRQINTVATIVSAIVLLTGGGTIYSVRDTTKELQNSTSELKTSNAVLATSVETLAEAVKGLKEDGENARSLIASEVKELKIRLREVERWQDRRNER